MGSNTPPSTQGGQQKLRRVYLLTSPRVASNLFVKMLNIYGQPKAGVNEYYGGYFFMPSFLQRNDYDEWDKSLEEMSDEHKQTMGGINQDSMAKYAELLQETERSGKIMFVKEHIFWMVKPTIFDQYIHGIPADSVQAPWSAHVDKATDTFTSSNPTIVPDNILQTFQPTFLIRHPALYMPSLYRVQEESHGKPMRSDSQKALRRGLYTNAPVRALFDFYSSYFKTQNQDDKPSPWPLVIDAADLIHHPETVMQHFCHLTGFDFDRCEFNWEPASKEMLQGQGNDMVRRALSTLNASNGPMVSKAEKDIDIDAEVEKWKKEFGEEVASELEGFVRAEMPDYEYLRSKRWNPVGKDEHAEASVNT